MIRVSVKLIACAVYAGISECECELADGACLQQLLDCLSSAYPVLGGVLSDASFLVGLRRAEPTMPLSDGDEIFILRTLGGG